MTCTCPKCGGTMIAGEMTRRDVIVEFLLCFKCGLMKGKGCEMKIGRDEIADVAKVPESHVRCSTCIAYNAEYDYCEGWEQSAKPSDFCPFWTDKEKHSYWGPKNE